MTRFTPIKLAPGYDCVVIGGGINGAGIARDAALRGLKVLLLEKDDFGSATSAWNSRLGHGGLRYLENFEFDLVRESLVERERLLKNSPHLVKPLQLGIPVYRHGKRPLWMIEAGMLLYDLLSLEKSLPWHRLYSANLFLRQFPGINREGLTGGVTYFDTQIALPERLCLDNVLDAEAHGATVLNHAVVTRINQDDRKAVSSVSFTDSLSGAEHVAQTKAVVNASGPWVDQLLSKGLSGRLPEPLMAGTKGTHIVLKRPPQLPSKALYIEAAQDGRPLFILPWLNDLLLVGTTDDHYSGNLDAVTPTETEIEYLLAETNRLLPTVSFQRQDVLYAYAGVRPLPKTDAKTPGKVTRKHWIHHHQKDGVTGLFSVVGGKLTTYRQLAEEAVDRLLLYLGQKSLPCLTRNRPLPGAADIPTYSEFHQALEKQAPQYAVLYQLPEKTILHLMRLYGTRFKAVLGLIQENPAWAEPLCSEQPDIAAQIVYAIRYERAVTVEDVLLRRTALGLREGLGQAALDPVISLMAAELSWDAHTQAQHKCGYLDAIHVKPLCVN